MKTLREMMVEVKNSSTVQNQIKYYGLNIHNVGIVSFEKERMVIKSLTDNGADKPIIAWFDSVTCALEKIEINLKHPLINEKAREIRLKLVN